MLIHRTPQPPSHLATPNFSSRKALSADEVVEGDDRVHFGRVQVECLAVQGKGEASIRVVLHLADHHCVLVGSTYWPDDRYNRVCYFL